MKRYFIFLLFVVTCATAQTINAAYVRALYQQYPTQKTDFCASCKLWVNPYYKSIADTVRHMPLVTYYVYTKDRAKAAVPRKGIYASWHSAYG